MCWYKDQNGLLSMLAVERSVGVAPQVILKNSLYTGAVARKPVIHSGFEIQRRRHQKSKTGVSVAPQKRTHVLQKNYRLETAMNKVAHFGFQTQDRYQQKTKTGLSVAP